MAWGGLVLDTAALSCWSDMNDMNDEKGDIDDDDNDRDYQNHDIPPKIPRSPPKNEPKMQKEALKTPPKFTNSTISGHSLAPVMTMISPSVCFSLVLELDPTFGLLEFACLFRTAGINLLKIMMVMNNNKIIIIIIKTKNVEGFLSGGTLQYS